MNRSAPDRDAARKCRKRAFTTQADRRRPRLKGGRLPVAGPATRRAAGVDAGHVYHDVASGVRDDRPGLDSCVRALRPGDVLVVWKLDRLGRTLAHLVNTVQDLSARGVGLRVLTGHGAQTDTTTAAGRLVFGIFAALAEFERELVRERTLAGLTAGRTFALSRKPRCGWPRPRWRTATPLCPRSAATSGSPP